MIRVCTFYLVSTKWEESHHILEHGQDFSYLVVGGELFYFNLICFNVMLNLFAIYLTLLCATSFKISLVILELPRL